MPFRIPTALIAVAVLFVLLATLASPATPHDHVGKPGSVCHVCSAAQPATVSAGFASTAPGEQLLGMLVEAQQHKPINCVRSLRIPRAPPA